MIKYILVIVLFLLLYNYKTKENSFYVNLINNKINNKFNKYININNILLSNQDKIIYNSKYKKIIKKYINKLQFKDIQIKYAIKYKIPIELVILWNFQESSFLNKYAISNNGNLNGKNNPKDWGSLQIHASGKNKIVKYYILHKQYDKYYQLAFKFMISKKDKSTKKWFTNWNSKNKTVADLYYKRFLQNTNNKNQDLRKLFL